MSIIALYKKEIPELDGYVPVALWTAEEYNNLIVKEHKKNGTTSLFHVTKGLEDAVKHKMYKNKQIVIQ